MVDLIRRLLVAGIALGAIAGNADEIKEFFDNTVAVTRKVATAGDMRSITMMLDREFILRGRYPSGDYFRTWMARTFKENDLKPLTHDHWGNAFVYKTPKNHKAYTLISCGPDGVAGTDDDLKITGP